MAQVVLDSSDLEAVLAEAQAEPSEPRPSRRANGANGAKAVAAPVVAPVVAETVETKEVTGDSPRETNDTDPDDIESEDGLTPRQKKEFSKSMLKAIGKKHRQVKEAEEFAAAQYSERKLAEDRAAQLQAALDAAKGTQAAPVKEVTKPKREDYATEAEFVDASVDFRVGEKLKEEEVKRQKEAAERAFAEMEAMARGRIAKAIDLVPDFVEVTQNGAASTEIVPAAITGYMQESEMFAELGYHLAKHPEIVVSLAKLKPALQLVQIGKIEATLQPFSKAANAGGKTTDGATPSSAAVTKATAASETTGLTPSKARNTAPVIQPLSTHGATVEKSPEDMDIREMIADFTKRNGVNLSLRKRH